MSFSKGDDRINKVKKDVERYNKKINVINELEGFDDFFADNGYYLTRKQLEMKYSLEVADILLSDQSYSFDTELQTFDDSLFALSVTDTYELSVDGCILRLPVGEDSSKYPDKFGDKTVIWNFVDNEHDFCYFIWDMLGGKYNPDNCDEDYDGVVYGFDFYDDIRNEKPEPQLIEIIKKLIGLEFVKVYTAYSEEKNPRLKIYGKSDETIDFALVDTSFLKDQELIKELETIMWD